jgi:protein arginine kinase activator
MLCERCKIREANIQYTEVIGGVKTEHNYCSQCAKEVDFGPYSAIFDSDFPLGKLLSGLLGVTASGDQETQTTQQIICPTCGTSYEEFIKNSRFGCPDCYSVFDLLIRDNIKQLQGSDTHKGKKPKKFQKMQAPSGKEHPAEPETIHPETMDPAEKIRLLEARLRDALGREDYETAALCRDEIRKIREGSASV